MHLENRWDEFPFDANFKIKVGVENKLLYFLSLCIMPNMLCNIKITQ